MSDNLPAINPAILPMVPETLLIASEEKLWAGMERLVKMYGRNLPKGVEPGTAILLMLAAKEYGLNPLEAISNLFFIGGRIVPSANTMVRLATGNGLSIIPTQESDEIWEAEFSRAGRESVKFSYTMERARKAGLLGSDTWKKHPQAMLRARCVSEGIRLYAGDLVRGMEYNAEELTNGTGFFDPSGNFTPDPSIVGTEPEKKLVPFEGVAGEKKPAKVPAKPKSAPQGKEDVTATVAQAIGKPAPDSVPQDTIIESPEHNGDIAVVATAAPAQPEVAQAAGITAEGKVITLARGQGNQVDFDKTIKNIFAVLTKATGSDEAARLKAKELLSKLGATTAVDLKGKASFVQFYLMADEFAAAALATTPAPAAIPDFDPKRGARTESSNAEVEDAEEVPDLDDQILTLFGDLTGLGHATDAETICENTGYTDEGNASPASVKLETIRQLTDAKLSAIKENNAAD